MYLSNYYVWCVVKYPRINELIELYLINVTGIMFFMCVTVYHVKYVMYILWLCYGVFDLESSLQNKTKKSL